MTRMKQSARVVTQKMVPEALRGAFRAAQAAGWTVTLTNSHHHKWQPPSGPPVFHSSTPGRGNRSTENMLAKLRRAGLEVRNER